ncbi:hypothetical protein DWW20_09330 [Ruminococcus sp. AF14-5]|nr:hypothetical protein DWW20_09330 [Ruminococcus sp. AF14-5]
MSAFEKCFSQSRIFHPNSVAVARYGALIRAKYPANCDAHLAESLFQTHSKADILQGKIHCNISITVLFMHFFLLLFSGFSGLWRASV